MRQAKRVRRPRGSVYRRPDSPYWHISFSRCGVKIRENTHLLNEKAARKLLDSRLGNIADGKALPCDISKTTVGELFELVRTDYAVNGRKSADALEKRIRLHLAPFFYVVSGLDGKYAGGMKSAQVTTDYINRYVVARQSGGATNGTINRELSVLRRGFSLGMAATPPKVSQCPNFPRLRENAPRTGFLEDNQYRAITQACPELWFRSMIEVARTYGWRSGELKQLRCEQVDLMNRTIRLHRGSTKNDDGRLVVMTDAVYTLLCECLRGKRGHDYVFTRRNGKPVRDFRKTWRNACIAASVPEALFHDWRRTGVRAMVRRGIPERVAMTISGHRTRSIFDRYNIVSEADLRDAARKMNEPTTGGTEVSPVSVTATPLPSAGTVN